MAEGAEFPEGQAIALRQGFRTIRSVPLLRANEAIGCLVIRDIQSSGVTSHRAIARTLNARGVATARGGQWTAVQVGAILRRI